MNLEIIDAPPHPTPLPVNGAREYSLSRARESNWGEGKHIV